jgi:hypothetical protein
MKISSRLPIAFFRRVTAEARLTLSNSTLFLADSLAEGLMIISGMRGKV